MTAKCGIRGIKNLKKDKNSRNKPNILKKWPKIEKN